MKQRYSFWVFILAAMTVLILTTACGGDDGNTTDGDASDGDTTDGDVADGDTPDGDASDGDASDGDDPDGDESDGDDTDGDVADGDDIDGDEADGDEADGDEADGDALPGEQCAPCEVPEDCADGFLCAQFSEDNKLCIGDCSSWADCPDGSTCTDETYCLPDLIGNYECNGTDVVDYDACGNMWVLFECQPGISECSTNPPECVPVADGDEVDGDDVDGDDVDGDEVDGDAADGDSENIVCDSCESFTGTYCYESSSGTGCSGVDWDDYPTMDVTYSSDCQYNLAQAAFLELPLIDNIVPGCFHENREVVEDVLWLNYAASGEKLSFSWNRDGGNCDFTLSKQACWEVDWRKLELDFGPPAMFGFAMGYDSSNQDTWVFGGQGGSNQTYRFDGNGWALFGSTGAPTGYRFNQMVYFSKNDYMVLYGGNTCCPNLNPEETWIFEEGEWSKIETATLPMGRQYYAMAYDPVNEVAVMQGGYHDVEGEFAFLNDTWIFDGSDWSNPGAKNGDGENPSCYSHGMAYDEQNERMLMLCNGKTYEFNGANWTDLALVTAPPNSSNFVMAYDRDRQVIVVYGGEVSSGHSATSELKGTQWVEVTTAHQPGVVMQKGGMVYHEGIHRMVYYGGSGCRDRAYCSETWTYGPQPPK